MCLKVIIADDEAITRADLKERLHSRGYAVVGEAADGFEAIELCKEKKPDLALIDIKMPILDGLGAAKVIHDERLANCIIMISAYSDEKYVLTCADIGAMGYIVKPFQDNVIFPSIEIAVKRSHEMNKLKSEVVEKEKKLQERKLIDKAKGIVMKRNSLSENEAYEYLRLISMNKRKPMKDVAEIIIMNDNILNG